MEKPLALMDVTDLLKKRLEETTSCCEKQRGIREGLEIAHVSLERAIAGEKVDKMNELAPWREKKAKEAAEKEKKAANK